MNRQWGRHRRTELSEFKEPWDSEFCIRKVQYVSQITKEEAQEVAILPLLVNGQYYRCLSWVQAVFICVNMKTNTSWITEIRTGLEISSSFTLTVKRCIIHEFEGSIILSTDCDHSKKIHIEFPCESFKSSTIFQLHHFAHDAHSLSKIDPTVSDGPLAHLIPHISSPVQFINAHMMDPIGKEFSPFYHNKKLEEIEEEEALATFTDKCSRFPSSSLVCTWQNRAKSARF